MDFHPFPVAPSPLASSATSFGNDTTSKQEIRLFGLGQNHTTPALIAFFSQMATVDGVLLHPSPDGKQWAQIWVRGEEEAERCMEARAQLGVTGVTMTRFSPITQPTPSHTPAPPHFDPSSTPTPALDRSSFPTLFGPLTVTTPSHHRPDTAMADQPTPRLAPFGDLPLIGSQRHDFPGFGHRRMDPTGALPRNLYIVDLPLDMTEIQFRALFERYGFVEHCKLLSQLDGNGRRRGFILMASHREALEAMRGMNGLMMDGTRIDVSWALVQREARHFGGGAMPNRVIHPPVHPLRREIAPAPLPSSTVIAEGLDPQFFPSANLIRELFSTFGAIKQASVLGSDHAESVGLTAIIQFESPFSADLLVQASGMVIGSQRIYVRHFQLPLQSPAQVQQYVPPPRFQQDGPSLPYQPRSWLQGGVPPLPPSTPFLNRSTPHQAQLSFDPFSADDQTRYEASTAGLSEQIAQSRLNAASTPFVPVYANQSFLHTPQVRAPSHNPRADLPQRNTQEVPVTKTPPASSSPTPQPKSSPSTGESSDTIVSTSTSSSGATQHGSRSSKTDGSGSKQVNMAKDAAPAEGAANAVGVIGAGRIGGAVGGVTSRMHERWLKGMGKAATDKWL